MANYAENSQPLQSNSPYFMDNDISWDLINPFLSMNPSLLQYPSIDCQGMMVGFSGDSHLQPHQTFQFHKERLQNLQTVPVVSFGEGCSGSNKRKAEEMAGNSCLNSSSSMSTEGIIGKNSSTRGKRAKKIEKKEGQKSEVVHVRARRGQATDSHSIAERIRRGKINEKLRCLQDIVPGCYKTMGMAVMLDEIINYVQSLQNQVEFLSMKLTAASQFHDFSAETAAGEKMQKMKAQYSNEAQDLEWIICSGGYEQGLANLFQPAWRF